jgi:PAS domain S-box-containing protein
MSKNIVTIIISLFLTSSFVLGQNAQYSESKQRWFETIDLTIIAFTLLAIAIIYTIHLRNARQKLSEERNRMSKLSIDLKSEVFKKDSQFKETSLALKIIKDNTFDAVIILNNMGRIIFWNSSAERIFGYIAEEVTGSDLIDVIIPKEKVVEFTENYHPDRTKEINSQIKIMHITAIRKDGTQFPAELSIADVRNEDSWNTVGIIRDITDQKTLEQELKLSENRLKLSLKGEEEYLWDWNIQTNEMYFSPTVQSMLGFEKKEVRRDYETWQKLIHPTDLSHVIYELDKHISGKTNMVRIEYRMRSAYDNWNWIYTRGKIVEFDDEKKPLKFIATNSDINEQKLYELDVQKLQEQLLQEKEKST